MRIAVEKRQRQNGMVRIRNGFSDTNGIRLYNTIIQTTEFEDESRILMSNELFRLLDFFFNNNIRFINAMRLQSPSYYENQFCKNILNDVFCERNTNSQYSWKSLFEKMHEVITNAEYNEVLDLIQYTLCWVETRIEAHEGEFYLCFNQLFEREYIGYRFINGRILAITDEKEIRSIEEACQSDIDGCNRQMKKAVGFLSDREKKDYKNCIKESISAVESVCQVIVGDEKATLNTALKRLEDNGTIIHPSLKIALTKLYAYTCDQGGIRHAEGMFESNVTFEEAKFMLVSCSAFINYLIAEYGKGSK